jgi:hypothetical protein
MRRRTDLPIPLGYIGLGDAFEAAYEKLERPERFAHDLESAPKVTRLDLSDGMLESEAIERRIVERHYPVTKEQEVRMRHAARRLRIEQGPFTLHGLDRDILIAEEAAIGRVERRVRDALSTGELRVYSYHMNGNEIPDRDAWRAPNFAIPGLDTFVDPDTSRGPDVGGSPVFVEEKAFIEWLNGEAVRLADLHVRTGKRGRPSVVKSVIMPEFARRLAEGRNRKRITDEARELQKWFAHAYPSAEVPAENTIKDTLRPFYQD